MLITLFFSYNNYDSLPLGQNSSDYGKSNYGTQGNQGKGSNTTTGSKYCDMFVVYIFTSFGSEKFRPELNFKF